MRCQSCKRVVSFVSIYLNNLIGNSRFNDGFLRQAFLGKPSPLVQTILAACLQRYAEVTESHTQSLSVVSVASSPATNPKDDKFGLLRPMEDRFYITWYTIHTCLPDSHLCIAVWTCLTYRFAVCQRVTAVVTCTPVGFHL